jgi:hypothetical protein
VTYEKAFDDEYDRVQALTRADALVCSACVLDRDLWAQIDDQLPAPGVCDFCGDSADQTATLDGVAHVVLGAVARFYTPLGEANTYVNPDDGEWTVPVLDTVEVLFEFTQDAVVFDVESPLTDYVVSIDTDHSWVHRSETLDRKFDYDRYEWQSFAGSTRASDATLAGYMATLDPQVQKLLRTVLAIMETGGSIKTGMLPPLWRGRPAGDRGDYTAARELGSPPDGAGGQNRMTAAGDSVFYGSTERRGVVIELVQDKRGQDLPFWVGRFTGSQEVRYLDTFDHGAVLSPYSVGAADIASAHAFLKAFAKSVSQPKPPPGTPSNHYLPTQVFVEVLRRLPEGQTVDAVRYRSSLDPTSENWVVFVDQDHCVDQPASTVSHLLMVLEPGSAVKLNGKDFTSP